MRAAAHAHGQVMDWAGLAGQEDVAPPDRTLLASVTDATAGRREPRPGALWEDAALAPLIDTFVSGVRVAELARGQPVAELARWPGGRPFAVALTHDVDQIHDRGGYRTLADLNHLQKVARGAEPGRPPACVRRIVRSILRPMIGMTAFQRIRDIESQHGCKSTFFFLEGNQGRRFGARYSLSDRRVRAIGDYLLNDDCEIGVHGGYYDFNEASGYRRSALALEASFGLKPDGIRNHLLRWVYPATWRAQAKAGYVYDATFGRNEIPGFRSGVFLPFLPWDEENEAAIDIVVLPLTVMDWTLFRGLALDGGRARELVGALLASVERIGGLATLSWHNNFFAEEEYSDWERTYGQALADLSLRSAWCEKADEIAAWWRRRSGVRIMRTRQEETAWGFRLTTRAPIDGLVLRLSLPPGEWSLAHAHKGSQPRISGGTCSISLPALDPARPTIMTVSRSSPGSSPCAE